MISSYKQKENPLEDRVRPWIRTNYGKFKKIRAKNKYVLCLDMCIGLIEQ